MSIEVVRVFEATEAHTVNTIPGEIWMYGVGAFVILAALMYIISRFNPDR
jgi:hypothetical protein